MAGQMGNQAWRFNSSENSARFGKIPYSFNVYVPGLFRFRMGSPSDEQDRYDYESPAHEVIMKNSFYMGKYPVTQKQMDKVMGSKPSNFKGEDLPVESVSWNDVQEFIKKLNENDSTGKYRLPSEAEWEYACRAGTTTRYSFGDEESKLGDYAWYDENSGSETDPVGEIN